MIDFALDPQTRRLVLPLQPITGAARVAQSIVIRLRCWLGEWFLDTTHGVPYLERVLGKVSRRELVEAVLRAQVLGVANVDSIETFVLQIDDRTRSATIVFEANTKEGLAAGKVVFQG